MVNKNKVYKRSVILESNNERAIVVLNRSSFISMEIENMAIMSNRYEEAVNPKPNWYERSKDGVILEGKKKRRKEFGYFFNVYSSI